MADRDKWLNEVGWNMFALGRAPTELRADREVVMAACLNSGVAFRYADQELRSDAGFARDVVMQNAVAFEYVGDNLRYDRNFVLAVVSAKGEALAFCEDDFRGDRQVVVAAAKQDPEAQKHALPPLDTDPTVGAEANGGAPPPPVYAAAPPQVYDSPPPVYANAGEDVKELSLRQDNNGDPAPDDQAQSPSLPKPDPEALEQEFAVNENVAILSDDWYTDGVIVDIMQDGYVVHFCQGTQEVLVPFDLAPQHLQKVANIEAQPVACDMGPGDAVLSVAYCKGDPVQVYSSSKGAWLEGAIVDSCEQDSEFNGAFIPAGSFFVQYGGVDAGGQNLGKWVMPEQLGTMLRPMPELTPEEADRREAQRLEAERAEQARAEQDRLEAKAQRMEQEAAERRAAEQASADQAAAEQAAAEQAAAQRGAQDQARQAAADQAAADQAAAEQAAADQAAAEQAAAEQAAAQQAKAERQRQAEAQEQRRKVQEEAEAKAKQEAEAKQAAEAAAAASAGGGFVEDPSLSAEQNTQVKNLMTRSGANEAAVKKALKTSGWHAGKAFRELATPAKAPGKR